MIEPNNLRAAIELIREAYIEFAVKLPKYPAPTALFEQEVLERSIESACEISDPKKEMT